MKVRANVAVRGLPRPSVEQSEYAFTDRDYRRIAAMIRADAGIDLREEKSALVYSRLVKRLRALRLKSFEDYCNLVEANTGGDERVEMLSALTTNVTNFFRERHHFEHLRQDVLPPLIASARAGGRLRIWSAGCSTGQEPYSIALSLLSLEPQVHRLDVKILATDIDPRVVEAGRGGVYSEAALAEVSPALRQRYFTRGVGAERESFSVADQMRALVAFRVLNLNADWPMGGQFAVIFCRNVVIYFDEQVQRSLWSKFATKLAPGGWLYIGHSERVSGPAGDRLRAAGTTTYQLSSSRHA
jgi:chemotaxis protein methyltransferase CheR